jgi:hypothetical protein
VAQPPSLAHFGQPTRAPLFPSLSPPSAHRASSLLVGQPALGPAPSPPADVPQPSAARSSPASTREPAPSLASARKLGPARPAAPTPSGRCSLSVAPCAHAPIARTSARGALLPPPPPSGTHASRSKAFLPKTNRLRETPVEQPPAAQIFRPSAQFSRPRPRRDLASDLAVLPAIDAIAQHLLASSSTVVDPHSPRNRRRQPPLADLAAPCPHRHRRGELAPSSLPFPILPLPPYAFAASQQSLVAPFFFPDETSPCRCPASRLAGPARGCFRAVAARSAQRAWCPACKPRASSPCPCAQRPSCCALAACPARPRASGRGALRVRLNPAETSEPPCVQHPCPIDRGRRG